MHLESLSFGLVAAFVIAQVLDKVVKPLLAALALGSGAERRAALGALWPFYVSLALAAGLAWATGLNLFPVFRESPLLGRVLSCLAIGLGPSFLHDLKDAVGAGENPATN